LFHASSELIFRRNVHRFRTLLDASLEPRLQGIKIIGVGGVRDKASASRMYAAGANVVALATALGLEGVEVFKKLS
jgi:dihydroorotate dehydrogenase (fumarate)